MQKEFDEARRLFQQGLALYEQSGDRGGLTTSLHGLGAVACSVGEMGEGARHLARALRMAMDIRYLPLALAVLITIAELHFQLSALDRGVEILSMAMQHPSSNRELKARAKELRIRHEPDSPSDLDIAAEESDSDLEKLVVAVLADLEPITARS